MKTLGLLLVLLAAPLAADAAADYTALLDAYKAKEWGRTIERAEAFVKAHPDFKHAHAAMYMGGNAGLSGAMPEKGEWFYRTLMEKHPDSKYVEKARNELVALLVQARRLEDCIRQCEANMKAAPDSKDVENWRWNIADAQFRLWKFKEAEAALKAFLKDYPQTTRSARAHENLSMINPPVKVGAGGIVEGYSGKYVGDARFNRAVRALPGYIPEAWKMLAETLGVNLAGKCTVVFEFRDKGFEREPERAVTETISLDYKPVNRIVLYTEHVVVSEADFRSRVIHELKHAAFRDAMGQRYLDLPKWVREGLAVYGAKQTEDRIAAVLSNEFVASRDPRKVLDGIDDRDHNTTDYIEDAMAFAWLESRKKGAVHEYCRRLLAGEKHEKLFADLAGMEFAAALKAAAEAIKADINKRLGAAEAELASVQKEHSAAIGRKDEAKWAKEAGIVKFEAWVKANPDHLLATNARYRLARLFVATGRHEDGRAILKVIAADELRCTLTDDAVHWVGCSYELEGKAEEAAKAFGVLLRDYCWSAHAAAARDKYATAGPVRE